MAMMLGEAVGRISLDASQLFGEAKRVESTLTNLDGTAGRTSGGFTRLANGMAGLGTALLVPMGIGLKSAVDLEHAVQGINASLGGLPQGQLDALTEELQRVGTESQYSATEVAAVADELARAGFAFEDIVGGQMTEAVVNLSQATGADLMTSVSGVTSVMNLWSEEIVGVENAITSASQAADIFTIAANESSAEVDDIIAGVRNLGPGMTAIGGTFEETAAAIALFTNNGLKAADSGVSMQRAIENLTQPTAEAQELMNQLGITAFDLEGNFVGLPVLFDQLHNSMKDMTPEARQMALSTIFGAEAIDVMTLAVLQGGDPLRALMGLMDETGVAAEQSALRMDTLRGQWETLKEGVGTLLGSLVTGLIPGMRLFVDAANGMIDVLSGIPGPIKTVVGAIAGLLAAFAAVTRAMQAWRALDMFLGGGTRRAGLLGLGAMGPVLLGLAAIVGVAAAAIKFNLFGIGDAVEAFKIQWQGMSQMRNPVSAFLDSLAAALRTFDLPLFDRIARGLNTVSNALEDFTDYAGAIWRTRTTMNKLLDGLPKPLQTFARGLGIVVDTSRDFLEYWRKDGIMGVLRGIPDEVGDIGVAFGTMAMGMQPFFQALAVRFPRFADSFLTLRDAMYPLANVFRETGLALRALFLGDWQVMLDRIQDAGTSFLRFGGLLQEAVVSGLSEVGRTVAGFVVDIGDWVLNVGVPAVIGAAPDIWNAVSDWVVNTAWPAVSGAAVSIAGIVLDIVAWARGAAPGIWEFVSEWVSALIATAGSVAGQIAEAVLDIVAWARGTAPQVQEFVSAWVEALVSTAGNVAGEIQQATVNIISWAQGEVADVTSAIESWMGTPLVPVTADGDVSWGDIGVPDNSSTALMIRDKIGDLTVAGIVATLNFLASFGSLDGVADAITDAKNWVIGQALKITGVALNVSFLANLGPLGVLGLAGVALVAANNVADYFANNPMSLIELAVAFDAVLDSDASDFALDIAAIELAILDALGVVPGAPLLMDLPTAFKATWDGALELDFSAADIVEGILNSIIPGGGALPVDLPIDINPFNDGGDGEGEGAAGSTLFGDWGTSLAGTFEAMRSAVALGMDTIRNTIQAKGFEWGMAMSGALASLNSGGAVGLGATIGGGAAGLLGGLQASVSTGMSNVTATITAAAAQWGVAMTMATATLGTSAAVAFLALQTSAQTGMAAATSAVSSGASQMSAALLGQLAGMQAGALVAWGAIANAAQAGGSRMAAAAAAASAATAQTIQAGMAFATAAVQSNASRWPGIISGYAGAMRSAGFSVGAAAGQGVAAGLLSTLGMVQAAASAIISTVAGAMTAAAMIASPSKLTAYIGEMMGMGLVTGLQAMQPRVAAASAAMIQTATPYTPGTPATYSYGGSTTNAPITIRNVDIHTQGKLSQDDKLQLARDFAESLRDGIDIVYTSHGAGS